MSGSGTKRRRGATGDNLRLALLAEGKSQDVASRVHLLQNSYNRYQKIQMADPKTGLVLFSTDESLVGETFSNKPSFTSALERIADTSVVPEKDGVSGRAYLVFSHAVSAPSSESGSRNVVLAVAMLYVDIEDVVKPLLYPQGFGESSDVVLVDQNVRILMSLKYPLADGTEAKVLEHVITAEPARLSLRGEEGMAISTDYRGVPVLSVYRRIQVTPSQRWGLVFKLDRSEVLQPLMHGVEYSFVIALMGVMAVAAMALLIAGRIARPVESLSRVAQEVKAGDLSVRAPAVGSDEIGSLCTIFNSMIDRVENWHQELEKEVRTRTAELRQLYEDLAAEVSVRKEIELSLAAERERLSVTLWSIGDGVIGPDTDGNVLSLNRAAEEFTGWGEAQAIGRPLEEVFHIINEKTGERCEDPVTKVLQTGQVVLLANDTVLIARDGRKRVLADSAAPIRDRTGNMLGVVLVFRDVTERKRAEQALRENEERFRTTFEQAAVGIAHVSLEGRYLRVNQRLCAILGYTADELMELTLSDLTHPDDLQETNDNLNRLLAGEIETFSLEKRGIRKDGGVVWLNLTVSLHRDAVNGQNYFISVAEEISNRKETEKALQLTLSELEGSNAELQQFAYVASHDLQEPLRMISSYVQLLERRYKYKLGEDADDFISYAVDGAKRMQGLISDLLRLSRVGTREKSIETIDCEEVLDQALANLRVSIAECCAQVTREPLPTVTADATQIVHSFRIS